MWPLMTQSVLQLKKNADKLPGNRWQNFTNETCYGWTIWLWNVSCRIAWHHCWTFAPEAAIHKFVGYGPCTVNDHCSQKSMNMHGVGVLHSTPGSSNAAFAFMSETTFNKHIQRICMLNDMTNECRLLQSVTKTLTLEWLWRTTRGWRKTIGKQPKSKDLCHNFLMVGVLSREAGISASHEEAENMVWKPLRDPKRLYDFGR